MKKNIFYLTVTIMLFGNVSCKKFLEQSSQDLMRPVSVANYKELLQGEAYFKDFYAKGWFVDAMTDDIITVDPLITPNAVNGKLQFAEFAFKWARDLETPDGTFVDKFFQHIYRNIIIANTCLTGVEEVKGTEAERDVLRGQALFTRAYAYFVLANLYAQAYNEAQPEDFCVPLILDGTPSLQKDKRATIKQVWDQISEDIDQSVAYLANDTEPRSTNEINYKAAVILATRVFLYKQDYAKVIGYGTEYLKKYPELKDISAINGSPATTSSTVISFLVQNPEVAFTFSPVKTAAGLGTYAYIAAESISRQNVVMGVSFDGAGALLASYGTGDRRKNHWFAPPLGVPGQKVGSITYTPMKFNYYNKIYNTQSLRTGEVYLNVAEAYARQASPATASTINLLNQLRSKRISGYVNLTAANFSSPQALVQFVWEERRRELCFEEFHRWWDLRRTGQPAMKHRWLNETYELKQKDPAYVLNFPKDELDYNSSLIPNVRPDRSAE